MVRRRLRICWRSCVRGSGGLVWFTDCSEVGARHSPHVPVTTFALEPVVQVGSSRGASGFPLNCGHAHQQLDPFPEEELRGFVNEFPNATEVVWCQEEPRNQGAWYQIRHHLQACISERHELKYVGRPHSASPAVGYYAVHVQEQQALVNEAIL